MGTVQALVLSPSTEFILSEAEGLRTGLGQSPFFSTTSFDYSLKNKRL